MAKENKSITNTMKTYLIIISQTFPQTHSRKGEPTKFIEKINALSKLHTIRLNYEYWKKRIDEVNAGKAILKVMVWTGKPYNSKQECMMVFDKDSGIGVQKLMCNPLGWVIDDELMEDLNTEQLANNDGLSLEDFNAWFKGSFGIEETKAIIHFTAFRYS